MTTADGYGTSARGGQYHVQGVQCESCVFRDVPENKHSVNDEDLMNTVTMCRETDSAIICHESPNAAQAICAYFYKFYGDLMWTLRLAHMSNDLVLDDPPGSADAETHNPR